jgi:hypothetical protein
VFFSLSSFRSGRSPAAEPFAQLGELPATHGQNVGFSPQSQSVAAIGSSLQRFDVRDADQQTAMRAHELALELFLELAQRLIDELLPASMANRDVLLLSAEKADVFDGDQLQLVADAHCDVLPGRERLLG